MTKLLVVVIALLVAIASANVLREKSDVSEAEIPSNNVQQSSEEIKKQIEHLYDGALKALKGEFQKVIDNIEVTTTPADPDNETEAVSNHFPHSEENKKKYQDAVDSLIKTLEDNSQQLFKGNGKKFTKIIELSFEEWRKVDPDLKEFLERQLYHNYEQLPEEKRREINDFGDNIEKLQDKLFEEENKKEIKKQINDLYDVFIKTTKGQFQAVIDNIKFTTTPAAPDNETEAVSNHFQHSEESKKKYQDAFDSYIKILEDNSQQLFKVNGGTFTKISKINELSIAEWNKVDPDLKRFLWRQLDHYYDQLPEEKQRELKDISDNIEKLEDKLFEEENKKYVSKSY